MMPKLRRPSRLNLLLLALLVAGGVVYFLLSWDNRAAEAEKANLDTRLSAAQARLSGAKGEADLEALRAKLEEARFALPTLADAENANYQFFHLTDEAGLRVMRFDSTHTPPEPPMEYSAITSSIEAGGEAPSITAFLQDLAQVAPSPAVQELEITQLEGEEGIWHLRLQLATYYSGS